MAKKKGIMLGMERRDKRDEIMGYKGAKAQEERLSKAMKGRNWASQSEGNLKIRGKEAIKRVGEYKAAKLAKAMKGK